MKKRKINIGLLVGVILICLLLLYWLFSVTLIEEDENLSIHVSSSEQSMN